MTDPLREYNSVDGGDPALLSAYTIRPLPAVCQVFAASRKGFRSQASNQLCNLFHSRLRMAPWG